MYDSFNREISYLRISVTDRCDLRCTYCIPKEGVKWLPHEKILSFEEIVEIATFAVQQGIRKIRLTGGEPLVRKGITGLVEMLSSIGGLEDLSMTTNGQQLENYAEQLKKAGLNRINISLDTVNPQFYSDLTRGGNIEKTFAGIRKAKEVGFRLIKINCVLMPDENLSIIEDLKDFASKENLSLRFIHQMNLQTGEFSIVQGGEGGNCPICNRLRLTADGLIKPCLFSELGYSVKEFGIKKTFQLALENKPKSGTYNKSNTFNSIGG